MRKGLLVRDNMKMDLKVIWISLDRTATIGFEFRSGKLCGGSGLAKKGLSVRNEVESLEALANHNIRESEPQYESPIPA